MCQRCEKQVIEQGVLESDLPGLPFTVKKWKCIVPGCKGGSKVRDYGLGIFFFDPAKHRTNKAGDTVRGGWWNMECHYYLCSHHWKQHERVREIMEPKFSPEYFFSKIVDYKTKQNGKNKIK